MSFGASPSDIIIVVTFCKALYRKCRDAGGEYDEISREVRGMLDTPLPLFTVCDVICFQQLGVMIRSRFHCSVRRLHQDKRLIHPSTPHSPPPSKIRSRSPGITTKPRSLTMGTSTRPHNRELRLHPPRAGRPTPEIRPPLQRQQLQSFLPTRTMGSSTLRKQRDGHPRRYTSEAHQP